MKKVFFLVILLLICTGCSATYNIEIYNNQVKEDMEYTSMDIDKLVDKENTYREAVEFSAKYPYPAFSSATINEDISKKTEGIEYYDNELIDDGMEFGQRLSYHDFSLKNFSDSNLVKNCYGYFKITDNKDRITITSSPKNTCFDSYPMLDEVIVNLKTNHKVESNNADSVNGYHYKWHITRENKNDAAIRIVLKKNAYVFNYENEFFKKIMPIAIIIGIIVVGGGLTYIIIKTKGKKADQI